MRPDELTPREQDVYRLIILGRSNSEIASTLYVAETTVKSHVRSIMRKFDLRSRTEIVANALETATMTPAPDQPLTRLMGIRFVTFSLLATVGVLAVYGAIQNLHDTGNRLGLTLTPGGTTFDIEVPLLLLSLMPLVLAITLLTRTLRAIRTSPPVPEG